MTELRHIQWMRLALEEARRGWGRCSPNPMVGAAIVLEEKLVSLGYHLRAGQNHAEINALEGVPAGTDLSKATLYVTLEPCSTHGRTPPCCEAILKAGIGRVVVGCLDANPLHAGRGVEYLRNAGAEVISGVLEEECRRLNEHFFWWITRRKPWVILKMAMSLDGKIALPDGRSRWITGSAAREHVQSLRQLAGMVMVGGRTARLDNPELKVREPADWPRQPIPAVWTSQPLPPGLNLTADSMREVVVAKPATPEAWDKFLRHWGAREVCVLLLEGGGELAANALDCGIVNQVQFFIAPKIIGGRDAAPVVGGKAPADLENALRLDRVETRFLGEDLLYIGYPQKPVPPCIEQEKG
ncbi:MAG: bifunctional diaminohydroxyphosphoribosylaminopyrimidine deaminase/5-amino-6-(5-phosphoribosylamino)uracil reductase RibD [Victivallales bacterium]|nr:bifunctional diaminohydroxyphosphoribosylaminopyrimidine deaminase/5-amino-6-(5-phosphoribosylamino)uracil reductase RibD [Victivallales bacterium]